MDQLPFRHCVLTRLMCETGLHASEAKTLRWDQVDLERRVIEIGKTSVLTPKTEASHRDVMVGDGVAKDLMVLRSLSVYVFPGFRDPTKPMDNYRKALKTAVEKSGGECPTFCVSVIWSMLPERSKDDDDDDFERVAGRTAEGLQAA